MKNSAQLFLRLGLAFSFIYVAISSFNNPQNWIGFFPIALQSSKILTAFSIYELLLALWLLSNKRIFEASILSAATIAGIILFNLGSMDIIFRDITILLAAIALAYLSKR